MRTFVLQLREGMGELHRPSTIVKCGTLPDWPPAERTGAIIVFQPRSLLGHLDEWVWVQDRYEHGFGGG